MGSVQLIQNRMRALLYTCITLNLQVAFSCIIWVFPELQSGKVPDFASECCKGRALVVYCTLSLTGILMPLKSLIVAPTVSTAQRKLQILATVSEMAVIFNLSAKVQRL